MNGFDLDRRRAGRRILCGLALAWLLAAGTAAAQPAAADDGRARNLLLITIDTLRADAVGFMDSETAAATPNLDRLAKGGRVFTDAHAHNVVTLPSHANILTGLHPYQHGVRDNSGFRLPERVPTLATVLEAAGFATAAVVSAFPLDAQYGLGRGFDLYDDRFPKGGGASEFVLPERGGEEAVALGRAWWRAHRDERRFLWLHLFDPHAPYRPPEPFKSRERGRPYHGEVAATDAYLAPLLAPFLDGQEAPTLIVVTADHGEALGDHGEETHGLFAYEPTLKVPLVLWGAGVAPGRDSRPARHVDLLPTALAALGVEAPPIAGLERPGRSLLGDPATAPAITYFEALSTNLNRGWAPLRGVIREGGKMIALPLPELYHLDSDPGETRNRVDDDRRRARALLAELPTESVWPPAREATSGSDAAALRSLGYVASSAPAKKRYGAEDDPKNLIELDRSIHQLIDAYSSGDVARAVGLGRTIVAARPSMPIGHSLLAQALLEQGDRAAALAVMEKARDAGVASDGLLRQLGLTLAETGRGREAIGVLKPLADTGEPSARTALALAYSAAGGQPQAGVTLHGVLTEDPDNATAHEYLSLVYLRLGRFKEAAESARQAVTIDPRLHQAWNNLGVARYQQGDAEGAFEAWQRALAIEPTLWDALYNLGVKAAERHRPAIAKPALERFVAQAPADRYGEELTRARALLAQP